MTTKVVERVGTAVKVRARKKRFALFQSLAASLPRPLRILDVGGTQKFWEQVGFTGQPGIEIVLLNVSMVQPHYPGFKSAVGDARRMDELADKEFDVVFSNSVIEHVGGYDRQREMANEVRRVGKRYFVQTPSRSFPIEPHFVFPFFQFLPLRVQTALLLRLNLGWKRRRKINDESEARSIATSIRLLSERELKELFPEATIYKERLLGLTKSFVAYHGWNAPAEASSG